MKRVVILMLFFFMSCTNFTPQQSPLNGPSLTVTEINPNKWTALTRQNLDHLLKIYPLTPVLFTKDIHIKPQSTPSSHPVLTLNTRYAERPNLLLATFLHYQFHWWLDQKSKEYELAQTDLKSLLGPLPSEATYQHVLICFLEYEALIHYLNLREANKILKDIIYKEKVHPWIYKQVYIKNKKLKEIVIRFNLMPTF